MKPRDPQSLPKYSIQIGENEIARVPLSQPP